MMNGRVKVTACNSFEPFQERSADELLVALLSAPGKDIEQEWACLKGVPQDRMRLCFEKVAAGGQLAAPTMALPPHSCYLACRQ